MRGTSRRPMLYHRRGGESTAAAAAEVTAAGVDAGVQDTVIYSGRGMAERSFRLQMDGCQNLARAAIAPYLVVSSFVQGGLGEDRGCRRMVGLNPGPTYRGQREVVEATLHQLLLFTTFASDRLDKWLLIGFRIHLLFSLTSEPRGNRQRARPALLVHRSDLIERHRHC